VSDDDRDSRLLQSQEKIVERQIEAMRALDTKAGLVVGFVALSTVEILGFLTLAAADGTIEALYFRGLVAFGTLGAIGISAIASFVGILALWPRKVGVAPEIPDELQQGKATRIADAYKKLIRDNRSLLEKKQHLVSVGGVLVLGAMILYAVAAARLFVAFMPNSTPHRLLWFP
jgi:hypothetical protein